MEKDPEGLNVKCLFSETAAWPIRLEKRVQVDETKAELRVRYRLAWHGQSQLNARWACQWNLSLTAGDAPGRYLTLRGQPSLGSRGFQERLSEFGAIDEWVGLAAWFHCEPRVGFSWEPVETVSLSEAGYERLYQGTALLFAWPIVMEPGTEWEAMIHFEVRETQPRG
jgi:alpha-amylase